MFKALGTGDQSELLSFGMDPLSAYNCCICAEPHEVLDDCITYSASTWSSVRSPDVKRSKAFDHIPPVQNTTLPLKRSDLKVSVDSLTGGGIGVVLLEAIVVLNKCGEVKDNSQASEPVVGLPVTRT